MRIGRKWTVAVGVLAWLTAWSGTSRSADFAACVGAAADLDLRAKMSFQAGMRDMVARGNPGLTGLATLNMEHQIALARRRREELVYLASRHPDRVRTNGGVAAFTNFNWSKADGERFAAASPTYRKLMEAIAVLRGKTDGHPDWPELRRYVNSDLVRTDSFKALIARLSADRRAVATAISSCRPR